MESTLTLPLTDLRAEAGAYLGWGRAPAGWDAGQAEEVTRAVATALRKFYFAAPGGHQWSFLKPVAAIGLTTNSRTAPLPDDFGGFAGPAAVSLDGQAGGFWPLQEYADTQLLAKYAALPAVTGRPVGYAELQQKGTTGQRANRSELLVYPLPDADYVLSVPYSILPDYLTAGHPYPYGGAAHAETMKAGVRAACELLLDNLPGPEGANYEQCLAASVQYDRRHQPKTLGVNVDLSDWLLHRAGRTGWPDGAWHPLGLGNLGVATYQ